MSYLSKEQRNDNRKTGQLTDTERYELLANERRQRVLSVFESQATPVALETVAKEVAGRETSRASPDADNVQTVAVSLHHVHLPMMAALGIVEYDPESKRIES